MPTTEHAAQLVPIDSLKHYKGNARIGNIDVIRASLRKNGQYRPVVVRNKTREVLAGNHTWEAARAEGWTEIWATFVECDAQTARRINLVDNKAPELGGYDQDALIEQLQGLPELEGTGWSDIEVQRLTSELVMGIGGDTDPGPIPKKPRSKRGDLWILGDHQLLCGDATNADDVKALLTEAPVCLWTDPPYIGPDDNSSQGGLADPKGTGHSVDGLRRLLTESFSLADKHLAMKAVLYVAHPGGANSAMFHECYIAQGWRLQQTLVWLKESANMGWGHDYHTQHELIMQGDKYDAELVAYGFTRGRQKRSDCWYGNRRQCSVLEFDRPRNRLHPTAKSVGLVERCLVNSTPHGGVVYDPFVGSGTTLIACENLGRRCRAMEIDPGYCDVVVDRWQRHSGQTAEKQRASS